MGARVIQVIEVTVHRGENAPDNPHRIVTEYYSMDGELLCDTDPVKTPIGVFDETALRK